MNEIVTRKNFLMGATVAPLALLVEPEEKIDEPEGLGTCITDCHIKGDIHIYGNHCMIHNCVIVGGSIIHHGSIE